MSSKKIIILIITFILILPLLVFAKSIVSLHLSKEGTLSITTNIEGKITSVMTDNLKSGIEANIKYNFSLYKRNTTLGISTFSLVNSKIIEYNLRWDNLNYSYVIYNNENNFEFSTLAELEEFIFKHEFDNVFKIDKEGKYFVKLDFSLETLKLVPPFSFILIFVNIYNIKINDLQSNDVNYEYSKKVQ